MQKSLFGILMMINRYYLNKEDTMKKRKKVYGRYWARGRARLGSYSLSMAAPLTWAFVLPAFWEILLVLSPHCSMCESPRCPEDNRTYSWRIIMSVCGKSSRFAARFITDDKIRTRSSSWWEPSWALGCPQNDSQGIAGGDWTQCRSRNGLLLEFWRRNRMS